VGTALVRVDGVGEGVHRLRIARIPLHCDLDLVAGALAGEIHDRAVDRVLRAVDVLDIVDQTARIVERAVLDLMRRSGFGDFFFCGFRGFGGVADDFVDDLFPGDPFVGQVDGQTLVEERHLLQPAGHRFEVVVRRLENAWVRPESDRRAGLLGLVALLEGARHRTVVGLIPLRAVARDLHLETNGQCVDHRDAHPVQTTGHRVGAVVAAELAAGVQLGHHDVDGRDSGGVRGHRMPRPLSVT